MEVRSANRICHIVLCVQAPSHYKPNSISELFDHSMHSFHNAVVLEEVAKMAYRAETINPRIQPAPQELQDKHYNRKHGQPPWHPCPRQKAHGSCTERQALLSGPYPDV